MPTTGEVLIDNSTTLEEGMRHVTEGAPIDDVTVSLLCRAATLGVGDPEIPMLTSYALILSNLAQAEVESGIKEELARLRHALGDAS